MIDECSTGDEAVKIYWGDFSVSSWQSTDISGDSTRVETVEMLCIDDVGLTLIIRVGNEDRSRHVRIDLRGDRLVRAAFIFTQQILAKSLTNG